MEAAAGVQVLLLAGILTRVWIMSWQLSQLVKTDRDIGERVTKLEAWRDGTIRS